MRRTSGGIAFAALLTLLAGCAAQPVSNGPLPAFLRVATYNSSLYSETDGGLVARLRKGDAQAAKIAAVVQHQRPDLLLLNEFDYDEAGLAADLFQHKYLEVSQHGQKPIRYEYRYIAAVNTGVPSGMDLDHDGKPGTANDAWGFGHHPGQYGMLVLSHYPIDAGRARTFRNLRWGAMPNASAPVDPATGQPWYRPDVWSQLRLSSKSHWDLPVRTPLGEIHFLVSHPTPPVFDGPDDHNGARNRDEIRLWNEYISATDVPWLCDDAGVCGGLAADARFVIAGDQNSDPHDGDTGEYAIPRLLANPRVQSTPVPRSDGAVVAAKTVGGGNIGQKGDPAEDTGDFGPQVGNLRLDYVLPSNDFRILKSGVFWPAPGQEGADWIDATDHHMVWVDLRN